MKNKIENVAFVTMLLGFVMLVVGILGHKEALILLSALVLLVCVSVQSINQIIHQIKTK